MSLSFNTNVIETLVTMTHIYDIQQVFIECSQPAYIEIGVNVYQYNSPYTDVLTAQIEVLGADRAAANAVDFAVPQDSIAVGGAGYSLSGNIVSIATSGVQQRTGVIAIRNPPKILGIKFSAGTFPSSPGDVSVTLSASWR